MKNDFIKNKNNVVKSKSKVNFFAFLVIIVVSLCSVLGCVFCALNYFGVKSSQIYTAKAETWVPDQFPNLFTDFPSFEENTVRQVARGYSTLDYKIKTRANQLDTYVNVYTQGENSSNPIPFNFINYTYYTFFVYLTFDEPTYEDFITGFSISFPGTNYSVDLTRYLIGASNNGVFWFSTSRFTDGSVYPTNFTIHFAYKYTLDPSVLDSYFPFYCHLSLGLWQGQRNEMDTDSNVYYQIGQMIGYNNGYSDGSSDGYDTGFTYGTEVGYNSGYADGVLAGYDDGYDIGLIAGSNLAESYGIFSSCTFRYNAFGENNEPGWINNYFDYSEWLVVPSNYISPYYGGFYLNSNFDYNIFYNILQDSPQKSYIVADFGDNGISLDGYTLFQVIRYMSSTDSFVATGEFGSACAFRFLDGTYLLFNNADEYFSSIDLNSYVLSSKLRSIEFIAVRDYSFFTLMSNVNFTNAYFSGYSDGNRVGYDNGYNLGNSEGYNTGYNTGYNVALSNSNNYSFLSLMGAVVDAPIRAITGLLNFNLLGFNMLGFFVGLLTLGVILWVVKLLIAGKK